MVDSKELLKYLYRIDLDLTGLCNKTCSFCPRTFKSYPNVNEHMSLKTIEIVLDELRAVGFDGFIELAGRGEPTLHKEFEKVVDMVTAEPRTWKVRITTNGYRLKRHWENSYKKIDQLILNTYTTREEFERRLSTYRYLANGYPVEHYYKPDGKTIEEINKLPAHRDTTQENVFFNYAFNNRAGSFSEKGVDAPCWHPMRQIFIDYHGNYQMCCNDWKYQIKIGNVHERSMMDMYFNDRKLQRIRWALINKRRDDILPCKMCDDYQGTKEQTKRIIERFRKTNVYKFHVCVEAGKATKEEKAELRGVTLIPLYQEE